MTDKIIMDEALAQELIQAAYKRAEQAMVLTKKGSPFATYWAANAAQKKHGLDETHVNTTWEINGVFGYVLIERAAWENFLGTIKEIEATAKASKASKDASDKEVADFEQGWMETMQAGVKP